MRHSFSFTFCLFVLKFQCDVGTLSTFTSFQAVFITMKLVLGFSFFINDVIAPSFLMTFKDSIVVSLKWIFSPIAFQ